MPLRALVPRRPGRPDPRESEALDARVLETATRVFIEHGYAAASMEQVALAAGVGKQTVYRRHPSKERLFAAVLEHLSADVLRASRAADDRPDDALAALRDTCRALLEAVSEPRTVAIYRVLVSESQRFPRLVEHTTRSLSRPFLDRLRALLELARRQGRVRPDLDPQLAARALNGLVTGWPLRQGLLGLPALPDASARRRFLAEAWSLFEKGVTR